MDSQAPSGATQPMKGYTPPVDWDELKPEGKIERMRDIIKNLQSQVSQNQVSIHGLRLKLKNHDHIDGKVYEMKEIKDYEDSHGGLLGTAVGMTLGNGNYF